jgi:hypothetical protein
MLRANGVSDTVLLPTPSPEGPFFLNRLNQLSAKGQISPKLFG